VADLRILVVDDSPTMRRILINTIQKAGFSNIKDAEDGKDALAKLLAGEFDLLMTDWNMPNMNGLELTEAIRKNDKFKNLPILMITTRNMKEDIVNAIKAGVSGYIVKPFDAKTLNAKIAEIMVT
jgi:two-component system chemotaxis response regulator CheY